MKKNDQDFQEILKLLQQIKEECRVLRNRMVSLESWMAAMSKGKDLNKSHSFAKDVSAIRKRITPTLEGESEEGFYVE